jgi:hypothetical protein
MYQPDRFLEYAAKHFKQKIASKSMDEIRDLRERDLAIADEEKETVLQGRFQAIREQLESKRRAMIFQHREAENMQALLDIYQQKLDMSNGEDRIAVQLLNEIKAKTNSAKERMERLKLDVAVLHQELNNFASGAK